MASDPHGTLSATPELGRTQVSGEHPAHRPDAAPLTKDALSSPDRYVEEGLLGAGGMGEVLSCHDRRLGRTVARKVVRSGEGTGSDTLERFLREARVQGQLEHPSVVPVYDLGLDAAGNPYFTMKRVAGVTLQRVLADLRDGDAATAEKYTRHRLLTAFTSVCMAVDYAHSRGIVHRDLKPANVMLGDFGEVYVLDWGLAKPTGVREPVAERATLPPQAVPTDSELHTLAGTVMGSPGYLAPEQARGEPADARSDVYALGTILFELLAGEPLHQGPNVYELLASTVRGADARPSVRRGGEGVAPELDALCVAATALDPAARLPSVRALVERLEAFLAGERDGAMRAEAARAHARSARAALAAGERTPDARKLALREVGKAIALDSTNADALRLMVELLSEPPRELPPEARAEQAESARRYIRVAAIAGAAGTAGLLLYLPVLMAMGVKSWAGMAVIFGSMLAACLASVCAAFWPSQRTVFLVMTVSTVMTACTSLFLGPFVVVPSFAGVITLSFVVLLERKARPWGIGIGLLGILVPALLELTHTVPPSFRFEEGALVLTSRVVDLPPAITVWVVLLTGLTTVGIGAFFVGRLRDALSDAENRLFAQTWTLRQLVPDEVMGPSPSAPRPPAR